jgi:hypothetical protein
VVARSCPFVSVRLAPGGRGSSQRTRSCHVRSGPAGAGPPVPGLAGAAPCELVARRCGAYHCAARSGLPAASAGPPAAAPQVRPVRAGVPRARHVPWCGVAGARGCGLTGATARGSKPVRAGSLQVQPVPWRVHADRRRCGPSEPGARRCGPCSGRPVPPGRSLSVRVVVSRLRKVPAAGAVRVRCASRCRAGRCPQVRVRRDGYPQVRSAQWAPGRLGRSLLRAGRCLPAPEISCGERRRGGCAARSRVSRGPQVRARTVVSPSAQVGRPSSGVTASAGAGHVASLACRLVACPSKLRLVQSVGPRHGHRDWWPAGPREPARHPVGPGAVRRRPGCGGVGDRGGVVQSGTAPGPAPRRRRPGAVPGVSRRRRPVRSWSASCLRQQLSA